MRADTNGGLFAVDPFATSASARPHADLPGTSCALLPLQWPLVSRLNTLRRPHLHRSLTTRFLERCAGRCECDADVIHECVRNYPFALAEALINGALERDDIEWLRRLLLSRLP